jgi:hypothetical protein
MLESERIRFEYITRRAAAMKWIPLLLICFSITTSAQVKPSDFVLDSSMPYAYLKFDHVGPRTPLYTGDDPQGLWLRIVNNCRAPITVTWYASPPSGPGVAVIDEVIPVSSAGVRAYTDVEGPTIKEIRKSPPPGYSSEVGSLIQIPPGKDLLISVPRNHVSKDWYMRVTFTLDVGQPSGTVPRTELDFYEELIPAQVGKAATPPSR